MQTRMNLTRSREVTKEKLRSERVGGAARGGAPESPDESGSRSNDRGRGVSLRQVATHLAIASWSVPTESGPPRFGHRKVVIGPTTTRAKRFSSFARNAPPAEAGTTNLKAASDLSPVREFRAFRGSITPLLCVMRSRTAPPAEAGTPYSEAPADPSPSLPLAPIASLAPLASNSLTLRDFAASREYHPFALPFFAP